MNGLRDRKVDDLMTVLKDGGKLMLEIDYEERRNLMANLDVVVHFKNLIHPISQMDLPNDINLSTSVSCLILRFQG